MLCYSLYKSVQKTILHTSHKADLATENFKLHLKNPYSIFISNHYILTLPNSIGNVVQAWP